MRATPGRTVTLVGKRTSRDRSLGQGQSAGAPGGARPLAVAGYRCVREIGAGATARVFLAEDVVLQRFVALKVLRSPAECPRSDDENIDDLFKREAQLLSSVVHDNLPRVYSAGRDRGQRFIAMEYVAGESLGDFIERYRGPFGYDMPVDVALALARAVAEALEALHAADTLHLDVKPSNVLIGPRYRVCLVDLSLGRGLRAPVTLVGTPPFIAPEVIKAGGTPLALPVRADVYGLAACTFALLTGECHVDCTDDASLSELLAAITMRPPRRADGLRPDLPRILCDVLAGGLARDPRERYERPRAFIDALAAARTRAYRAERDRRLVLAVDDDPDTRELTGALIAREMPDVRIETAADGLAALAQAKTVRPDLVLLDLELPRVDGFELCAIFRATPSLVDVPILVVSGHLDHAVRARLRSLGVDAALQKGGDPRVIAAMARQLVAV